MCKVFSYLEKKRASKWGHESFLEKSSSNRVTTLKKPKKNRVNSMQNPAIFVVYHHVSQTFAHKKLTNQMIGESNSRPPNWCNLWATWQAWFPSRILAKKPVAIRWLGVKGSNHWMFSTNVISSRLYESFSTTDWCSLLLANAAPPLLQASHVVTMIACKRGSRSGYHRRL